MREVQSREKRRDRKLTSKDGSLSVAFRYKVGNRILIWDGTGCRIIRTATQEEESRQTELRDRLYDAASIINELLDDPPRTLPKLNNG